jgi:hypothetical protein
MKTLLITLLVAVLLAILVGVVVLAVFVARRGQREYQRYSGLEHQRAAAKQSRDAGVDRLKDANRYLVETQRAVIARGDHSAAQDVERLRSRLSTMADRTRFATHGYAPLHSPNPVREDELAELQAHDAETITDAQMVTDLCQQLSASAGAGEKLDLHPLESALGHLSSRLEARKALT